MFELNQSLLIVTASSNHPRDLGFHPWRLLLEIPLKQLGICYKKGARLQRYWYTSHLGSTGSGEEQSKLYMQMVEHIFVK